tara:strand:- start:183 stop:497 length:315 start_codon:yes stop_codon:yes gene_type:complete
MKKTDYIDIILKTIILLGVVLIIYWWFELMFGGSPPISQFNAGLIFLITGLVVHLYYKFGAFSQFSMGTFPMFEKNIEKSFIKIREDMVLIKNDMESIKNKLNI